MTWVDLAVLGVLAVSALLAFMRGFVREVLGIGAWVGAAATAVWGFSAARPTVEHFLGGADSWIVDAATASVLFVGALIILLLVAHWVGALTRGSVLGGLDRTLGLLFGLVRGAALVIVAYIVVGLVKPTEQWPDVVRKAVALDFVYNGAVWASEHLVPAGLHVPPVPPPPQGRQATADALMQAAPQGRATGKAPVRD
jgi:membrane protein required for colicin V production